MQLRRPSPWAPFCVAVRLAALAPLALVACPATHAPLWGRLLVGLFAALALLRVCQGRLLVELAALDLLIGALAPPLLAGAVACALASLAALALRPESSVHHLNGIDRYFVAQDYPGTPMNTHHFVDVQAPLDRGRLEAALMSLAAEVPMARTFLREAPLGAERFVARRLWVPAAALLRWSDAPFDENGWLESHFDLEREPPWRLSHAPRAEGGYRLILSVHHSAFDGEAGLLFTAWLLRRYHDAAAGVPGSALPSTRDGTRFRTLLRPQGFGWMWRMIRRHVRPLDKVGVVNATMQLDGTSERVSTRHRLAEISPALWERLRIAASTACRTRHDLLLSAALCAVDACRRERKAPDRNLRVLLPANLRATLSLPLAFGNYLGVVRAEFSCAEVRAPELPRIVSERILFGRSLEEAVETPVNLGVLCALLPTPLMRAALRRLDQDPRSSFFTLLFSTMRVPASELPDIDGIPPVRVLVRGSMTRRPGFGVSLTVDRDRVGLAYEYLSPLVSAETVERFHLHFGHELERLAEAPAADAPRSLEEA